MAYNKVGTTIINRVKKAYGDDSKEAKAIELIAKSRVPYEAISEVLGLDPQSVQSDLTGIQALANEDDHRLLINCTNGIIPLGLERGLLPCKDTALTVEVLRVLIEILSLQQQLRTLS